MCQYPSYMIPFLGLNPKVKIDDLMKYGDFSVARRVDASLSEAGVIIKPDGSGIVKADSPLREQTSFLERIPNLSMTMMRQDHSISSAKFHVEMEAGVDDWKGGIVKLSKFKGKAKLIDNCFLMVYKASLIHEKPAHYQRKFTSFEEADSVKEFYDDLKDQIVANKFTKSTFYKAVGQILLQHSPTMLNYWHYELKLKNSEGEYIERVKFKNNDATAQMNMRPSFVIYVLEHFLFKFFWVDLNPCGVDIPYSCFFDKKMPSIIRWLADKYNSYQCERVSLVSD